MTAKRLAGALLGGLVAIAVLPAGASACTCAAEGSPVEHAASIIESSDAAFIGVLKTVTYLDDDGASPSGDAVFRYRVRREISGKLPRKVSVLSSADEATCGLPANRGRRYGVGLSKHQGSYSSSLCSTTTARLMRKAADLAEGERSAAAPGCAA